ncbi:MULTISPECIES: hypothetical protein, partial [unclassified Streptomyces]|uniref:hypothetical protein n=1 Tax=unclassified Streptomyces TaxID=2593676 RepID=UPI00081F30D0
WWNSPAEWSSRRRAGPAGAGSVRIRSRAVVVRVRADVLWARAIYVLRGEVTAPSRIGLKEAINP